MKSLQRLALLALPLVALACGSDERRESHDRDHGSDDRATEVAVDPTVPSDRATVYALACGCSLPEVGHCSEWAEVGDQFVELEPPLDLGYMPFCGKHGLRARMDAELVDGKLVASTFAFVE